MNAAATVAHVPAGVLGHVRIPAARARWGELTTAKRLAVGHLFVEKLQEESGTDSANVDAIVGFYDEVSLGKPGRWHVVVPRDWQDILLREARRSGLSLEPWTQLENPIHFHWGVPLLAAGAVLITLSLLMVPGLEVLVRSETLLFVVGCVAAEAGLAGVLLRSDSRGDPTQ